MTAAEKLVGIENWADALRGFRLAAQLRAGDKSAASRISFCRNRLAPHLAGFRPIGDEYDARTGLWREVEVVENGLRMRLVPAGEFDVGDDRLPMSRPVHTVRVRSFYLGKFEVTGGEWKRLVGSNPSQHQGATFREPDNMPVENVSWTDCQRLIAKLNATVPGGGFRLPTEVEWEFAARGGSAKLTTGPNSLDRVAWYRGNSARRGRPAGKDGNRDQAARRRLTVDDYSPRAIGTRAANARGFHDMQGNVWEWTSSVFRPYLSAASSPGDPLQTSDLRSVRGGSYADSAFFLRRGFRYGVRPDRRFRWIGLRMARDVPVRAGSRDRQ